MPEVTDRDALWVEEKAQSMVEPGSSRAQAPGEAVWNELDTVIDNRARQMARERREKRRQDELKKLTREQEEDRRAVNRILWERYHRQRARQYRQTLENLATHHEREAERYAAMA